MSSNNKVKLSCSAYLIFSQVKNILLTVFNASHTSDTERKGNKIIFFQLRNVNAVPT